MQLLRRCMERKSGCGLEGGGKTAFEEARRDDKDIMERKGAYRGENLVINAGK